MKGIVSWLRAPERRPDPRALLAAMLALAVLLPAWWLAARWYSDRLLAQERADVSVENSLRANALSSTINRRLARLQGLYAFVRVELSEEDFALLFQKFASGLYEGTRGIRSLTVAPGGIVRYVYPQWVNEIAVGYVPAGDPRSEVRLGVRRAMESREVILTATLDPDTGDPSLLAWQAVYEGASFWGLVSVVLDLPILLEEAGLGELPGNLHVALRDSSGHHLYGTAQVFETNPVVSPIRFPDDTWELAAAPLEGWQVATEGTLSVFEVGGFVIVVLVTGLVYLSVNRQARLAEAVRQRTQQIVAVNRQLELDIAERRRAEVALAEREAQYGSVFESTTDGLLIFDLGGMLVDANPAAARMHGYPLDEFLRLETSQFVHADSRPVFRELLETVRLGGHFRRRARDVRRDGSTFHIQVQGSGFTYRGEAHALAVVRDVTEEVQAYRLLEQRVAERTRELSTLLEVSANIAATLDLPLLLELILVQLRQVVDYDGASVLILEGDELRSAAHRGPVPDEVQVEMRLGREEASELWSAMEGGEPVIIGDVRSDTRFARAFRQAFGTWLEREMAYVRTWVGVPLIAQERRIGWLSLHHCEAQAYGQHQAALALTIANQAATAIQNASLYGQARRLAALEERQRLARELHDSVSQVLYGIGLGARTAIALLDRAAEPEVREELSEPLEYVLSLAEAGLAEMRALIFELRPDSLEREGLVAALARQADALRARHSLEVQFRSIEEPTLSFEAKEALYRIAQEALNNTVKHARAHTVEIRLSGSPEQLLLELVDDGIGFDPEADYAGHMGLNSMRERAAQVGGGVQIRSEIGRGTSVRVCLPA